MGILQNQRTDDRLNLLVRHLVGRSASCELRLTSAWVSGEHATVYWQGGRWWVHDLGSRNGTTVETERLVPGSPRIIKVGEVLSFGGRGDSWILADASAPQAHAVDSNTKDISIAEDGLLGLPDLEQPGVLLYSDDTGRWLMETDDRVVPVHHRDEIEAAGRLWRLNLPDPLSETIDLSVAQGAAPTHTLAEVKLHFRVSRDEEHVELVMKARGKNYPLGARAYNYMLLLLARARTADIADPELPETSHGWRYQDVLADELGVDPSTLKVHIFRARKLLSDTGVTDPSSLIERRRGTQQLRLGTAQIEIEHL